ncbi:hypothetical protein [Serratia fonticola]|uniref:Uncharacterized protein n=1 Tax=Serratia fonticola TaxID=47917 RepID=A0AAW3WKV6_SERFO|nr:hypothetical protein [Serratia fonticola]MBC3211411.1 hypothetical protein [Serratia fonticola]NYA12394.1 hypothetical protein [Serratia fonticola]NYA31973.1 hypothetical protein [Serratia fonticola]
MSILIDQINLLTAITKEIDRQHPGTGVEARRFNAIIKAANDICAEFAKPVVKASQGMGIAAWLASDDTGLSSKFMASVLTGEFKAENHYPRDPADFGRCLRLVNAVPGLAEKIGDTSQHGKHWVVVAENWGEWVEVYRSKDFTRLHRLMRACYEAGV